MDVIAMARELGHAIQDMSSYKEMMRLSDECDADKELQAKVEAFNDLRGKINQEIMKDDKDENKITEMDKDLRKIYSEITTSPKMVQLTEAKETFSQSYSFVSQIITASANGEDPDKVEMSHSSSCSGSCSSCGGCH